MANIIDYLKWRGDLDFKASPFNAVDNVILAFLSYLDMDEVFCGVRKGQRIPFSEAVDAYFASHTEKEIKNATPPFNEIPGLAREASRTVRYGSLMVSDYINIIDTKAEEQMAAMLFWPDDSFVYAAFRGTDSTIVGWKEDFALSYLTETPGQRHAVEFLNDVFSFAENAVNALPRLYVGGHSKGGNLAVYASAFAEPSIRKRIHTVFSNDGPGFREEIIHNPAYLEILPKIVSIIPESSLIGGLLDSHADNQIIKSSENGIRQHNAMSWEVLGTDFVRAERSVMGRFFDESVHSWLSGITDAERAAFTDSLFEVLEAGGARTVEDLKSNPLRTAGEMIKASLNMDSDKRREFTDLVLQLMASGANTIKEQTQEAAFKTGRGKSRKMRRLPNPENR